MSSRLAIGRNTPTLGTFAATATPLNTARFGHTAVQLVTGPVLIAGGSSAFSSYLNTAELFDPVSRSFTPTIGTMVDMRFGHTASTLVGGNILICGGTGIPSSGSAEVFDYNLGVFKATVPMVDGRYGHTANGLSGGKILLAGGQTVTGTASETWRFANFGTAANSGNAADTFDANNDGEVNLLEFATAQNPATSTLATLAAIHTASAVELTYTRSKAALTAGVIFTVEWSDTLATNSWSAAGVTQTILTDNGTLQTVKATIPTGSAISARFARLKVTSP